MAKRIILITVFTILILLVSFFGLGPVILADGTWTERMLTLLVVIVLYVIILVAFYYLNKRIRK